MAKRPQEAPISPFGLDRIVFFSDAVIVIAITLLVLDLCNFDMQMGDTTPVGGYPGRVRQGHE